MLAALFLGGNHACLINRFFYLRETSVLPLTNSLVISRLCDDPLGTRILAAALQHCFPVWETLSLSYLPRGRRRRR